jgi:uncharacterized protein (TIGR02145 family)
MQKSKHLLSVLTVFLVLVMGACGDSSNGPDGIDNTNKITDIDGNTYDIVTIGNQVWMADNLNVSRYTDGTAIPQIQNDLEWKTATTGAWCYYENRTEYSTSYGKLYNWYAVVGKHDNDPATPNKQLAPSGWHVPSEAEWTTLSNALGGAAVAGGKLKATGSLEQGTGVWTFPNTGATNSSGFNAVPAGYRGQSGFSDISKTAPFWTTTVNNELFLLANGVLLHYQSAEFQSNPGQSMYHGYSVRCVKN